MTKEKLLELLDKYDDNVKLSFYNTSQGNNMELILIEEDVSDSSVQLKFEES